MRSEAVGEGERGAGINTYLVSDARCRVMPAYPTFASGYIRNKKFLSFLKRRAHWRPKGENTT